MLLSPGEPFSTWELRPEQRHANRVLLGVWQPVTVKAARGKAWDCYRDRQSAGVPCAEWQGWREMLMAKCG